MASRRWTKDEIIFIKENYENMSRGELAHKLNRTYSAVDSKILELGIKKQGNNWTEKEIEFIKTNHSMMNYSEMAKILNRTKNAVQLKCNRLGLTLPEKYTYDVNFFEAIDTEDKAYWLGFIFADGYVTKSETGSSLGIELSQKDSSHLKKFNKSINGNVEVKYRTRDKSKDDFIKADETYSCSIRLFRNKIVDDLSKYGVVPRKTYLDNRISELIPKNLIRHFIRGYFDGDGTAYFEPKKDKQMRYIIYGISKTILEDIRKELYENGIYSVIISDDRDLYKKTATCYRLKINGLKNTINFYDYLYKDSKIYLDRKYYYSQTNIENFNIRERAYNKSK